MICPKCKSEKILVLRTFGGHDLPKETIRSRECAGCGYLFKATERIDEEYLSPVKVLRQGEAGK